MGISSPRTQLLANAARQANSAPGIGAAQRGAAGLARRGSRRRAGGGVMGRGRALALAAVLVVTVSGGLAARADAFVYWSQRNGDRACEPRRHRRQSEFHRRRRAPGVAVDGQHIYWANSGGDTIGRANLDGTGVNQSFITGARYPHGVAVDGQHIYWTNNHATRSGVRTSTAPASIRASSPARATPYGVAVDGQHIYWANYSTTRSAARTSTVPASIRASSPAPAPRRGGGRRPAHLLGQLLRSGTIGRANLDGTGVDQSFITGADGPHGVAVDGQHIYWANSPGAIGRANLDGTGVDPASSPGRRTRGGWRSTRGHWRRRRRSRLRRVARPTRSGRSLIRALPCGEGAGGPGIASCLDQTGRASGAAIDTSTTGPHTFTVTATSTDGQTATATETYTVAAPATANPVLGELRESHLRWPEGSSLPHITSHAKHTPGRPAMGTTFSFTLNQPATVRLIRSPSKLRVESSSVNGHRECVAQTKPNHPGRKCVRTVTAATLSLTAPSGTDKLGFAGRISRTRKLSLGSYTATITATNASGEPRRSRCGSRLSNSPKPRAVPLLTERDLTKSLSSQTPDHPTPPHVPGR